MAPEIDVTLIEEETKMAEAIDLAPNVAAQLLTESVANVQGTNATHRDTTAMAAGVLKAAQARNFDELGTVESRSTSGVLATPIAGPTTAQPAA